MNELEQFVRNWNQIEARLDQAIALLWFYRRNQIYEERTASELASDLQGLGLGRPNVTVLYKQLVKSKMTVKGKRPKTFQVNAKFITELDTKFESMITTKPITISKEIIPFSFVKGTRRYLEQMVNQINGSYEYTWYDCCAVLVRRLMESLIIEAFIHKKIDADIRDSNGFLPLEKLIAKVCNHPKIILGRNSPKIMEKIKRLGDSAAHDRTYITQLPDVDDLKSDIRKIISELLVLTNIQAKV